MRTGTTPTHVFTMPFGVDMIKELEITYAQNGKTVLTKYKEDCVLEGNTVSVTLTQQDTFEFGSSNVSIQVRVLTLDDNALASDIITIRCERCLSNEVL